MPTLSARTLASFDAQPQAPATRETGEIRGAGAYGWALNDCLNKPVCERRTADGQQKEDSPFRLKAVLQTSLREVGMLRVFL